MTTSESIASLFKLDGKTAFVTAAGQGMGRAIAIRLAEAGANVVVSHRRRDKALEVVETINAIGVESLAVTTDVTDLDQIHESTAQALDRFGHIDILVNNAGGMHPFTPFLEVTPETYQQTLDRNLRGTYFLTQAIARSMAEKNTGGSVVNIASTAAFKPDFQLAAYNAAKAGVISLTHSLCSELAPLGIRINSVVPGPTRTTNTEAIYQLPEIKSLIEQRVPLGSPGEAEDIANAVLFCASPASRHMTGGMIVIDGGFMWT
jgi:NAD(P)-dependent dehydrogenase (short-subunit alcohol dehydrogenase family)